MPGARKETIQFSILVLCMVLTVVIGIFIIHAFPVENTPSRQLSVHNVDIECTVTSVEQGMFNLKIGIYNEDLNMEKTFVLTGKDAERFREVKTGDTVTGYLYFWTNGDVIVDWVVLPYEVF